MRIRYLSSDACSSDLDLYARERRLLTAPRDLFQLGLEARQRGGRLVILVLRVRDVSPERVEVLTEPARGALAPVQGAQDLPRVLLGPQPPETRTEERRVGKEERHRSRSGGSPK